MTDSLDDFFAKKDKKRNKDKGKAVLSAEALVRELEEGSKQLDYPTRKETKTSTAIELLGLDANDADWRDFEDVEKRDYTGLKVKEMSLQDQTDEEQRRSSEQYDVVPETTPWKIKDEQQQSSAESISDATKQKATKPADTTSKSDTKIAPSSSKLDQQEQNNDKATISKTDQKDSSTDSTEKKGDVPSAKSVYKPPQARSDVKILEPSKLGKSKQSAGRSGPIPDIQDEKAFPSLG